MRSRPAVLVVRCDAKIGDSLLCLPFIRYVRQSYPEHEIHLLHHASARAIFEQCSDIDRRIEITWNPSSPLSIWHRRKLCAATFEAIEPGVSYDAAFAPRWDYDLFGPFMLWYSGAKQRIGFSSKNNLRRRLRNFGSDSLFTRTVTDVSVRHESIRAIRLLDRDIAGLSKSLPSINYRWSAGDFQCVCERLAALRIDTRRLVALAPGAAGARRQWPLDRFAELGRRYTQALGAEVILLGAPSEAQACERICAEAGVRLQNNFAGRLTLAQNAALLSLVEQFVGNDSGLSHLAAAAGCPSIVQISCHPLTGDDNHANSPLRFGPSSQYATVLQPSVPAAPECKHGCTHDDAPHCILGVTVDQVWDVVVGTRRN
ncbi:hypothetical protein RGE_41390 [Rubrivivax gelatinosus IL144]|uniref:Heptosyltransferase-2 n=1 Tax=Rubrivivax gelatinosus (strain NBRC 100245 / IL144) TaxID=983917 RepID=I0HWT8_RUBGI|nr:hypothetical protein RGE_41390 [Rubrivivax gelatinosus IL144]